MTPASDVPQVSGGQDERGQLDEFHTDPIALMQRARDECGDVAYSLRRQEGARAGAGTHL